MDYAEVPGREKVATKMDEFQAVVEEDCPGGSSLKFFQASMILLTSPHTINRRIAVSTELGLVQLDCPVEEALDLCSSDTFLAPDQDFATLQNLLHVSQVDLPLSELPVDQSYLRVAKLLPRDKNKFAATMEVAIVDRRENRLVFLYKALEKDKRSLGIDFVYSLNWDGLKLSLMMKPGSKSEWLEKQLVPKFVKWMTNEAPNSFVSGSLNLVEVERYCVKYDELKKKYGNEMAKNWTENTDPLKFVYEDVAIAAYLLLIWEQERQRKGETRLQSFVDVGCGNGLLVYILTSEGHPGVGIDLRPRKIWDLYPSTTKLEVRTIIPSSTNLFPQTDWLIGNHSDELTPWIPVIAARSSYNCNFFLLPCCAYEFDGSKYQRTDSSMSQYQEYMTYVQSICESCGFKTQVDKLRIPSTKRTCFVGSSRTYPKQDHEKTENQIQELIHKKSSGTKPEPTQTEVWSSFKPREVVEKVRNCTQIDRGLVGKIVQVIVKKLLEETNLVDLRGKRWNQGQSLEIKDAVGLLTCDQLKELKKECGGLQTLLKNNGHIFKVLEGQVRLRNYSETEISNGSKRKKMKKEVRKVKQCWFFENHPDGCPVDDDTCNFVHTKTEILCK